VSLLAAIQQLPFVRERILPLLASPIRRRLARGAFWGAVAAVGSRVITVVCSFLLARILGRTGFGEYGIVNGTAATVASLAGLGLGQTVTKHIAELKHADPERAGRILALSMLVATASAILCGIALFFFAPWLAERALAAPHLAGLLRISAVTMALGVLISVQSCSLSGCEAFASASRVNIAGSLLQSLLVVLGAWRWGMVGAVTALACGTGGTALLTLLAVRRAWRSFNLRLRWRGMMAEWRVLIHYSLPTFLILLFLGPVNWATCAFLANQPDGYAELGVFNAAFQWQAALQFLATVLCTATVPVMAEQFGAGEVQASLRVLRGMLAGVTCVTLPVALLLCLFSPLVMRSYGPAFADGYWTMIMLVLAGAVSAVLTPVASAITASGRMWAGFLINTGWAATMLIGGWYLVQWGAEGLAASRLLAAVIHLVIVLIVFPRLVLQ
jgi:O-antigen/teichoic acid export membrane protein